MEASESIKLQMSDTEEKERLMPIYEEIVTRLIANHQTADT